MTTSRTRSILLPRQARRLVRGMIGASLTLAPLVALGTPAPAEEPARSRIVAQSTDATAATGRMSISARIALARKPVRQLASVSPVAAVETTAANPAEPDRGTPAEATRTDAPVPRTSILLYPAGVAAGLPVGNSDTPAAVPQQAADSTTAAGLTLLVAGPREPVVQGGTIEWRLVLHNPGSQPVRKASVLLFFADGLEPVAASGHPAALAAGEVRFDALASLAPGETVELLVTGRGIGAGSVAYRAEVLVADEPEIVAHDGLVQISLPATAR